MKLIKSLGYGIIIDDRGNLSPKIESNIVNSKNITISFEKGAFLDRSGSLIVVTKELSISFNIDDYNDIYFYIKVNKIEATPFTREDFIFKIQNFDSELFLSKEPISDGIELCRIKLKNNGNITYPLNPFRPNVNELDIRYVPRILSNYSMDLKILEKISKYFLEYADFFAELGPKIYSFNASMVVANAYQSATRIKVDKLSTFEIYHLLEQLIKLTVLFRTEVEFKIKNFKESDFLENITRLESIFFEGKQKHKNVRFYEIELEEEGETLSFWSNIFSHIKGIYTSEDEWDLITKEHKQEETKKEYLILGRKGEAGIDIVIDNEFISGNHLKITISDLEPEKKLIDIEDLGSTNGTYINTIRQEVSRKRTLLREDRLVLYDYEINLYERKEIEIFLNN